MIRFPKLFCGMSHTRAPLFDFLGQFVFVMVMKLECHLRCIHQAIFSNVSPATLETSYRKAISYISRNILKVYMKCLSNARL